MQHQRQQTGDGGEQSRPARARMNNPALAIVTAFYALVAIAGAVTIAVGWGAFGQTPQPELRYAGYGAMLLSLLLAPPSILIAARARAAADRDTLARLDEVGRILSQLRDQAVLSDDARRVLNRDSERDLLCRAIEEDIARQDWDAGLVLCAELADRFGYRAEAEEFRARIENARAQVQERRVADAIANLDGLIVQRRWDAALMEAARIRRLFPDSPRIENLRQRVQQARSVYKADLERRFLHAAEQGDIDEAMQLIKELDGYLTESEAAPFQEVARGVIGKAKENLGAQFKIAVQDRQWTTAVSIGRRIVNEFPNTRMAHEVRQMFDGLLARANAGAQPQTTAARSPEQQGNSQSSR